MKKKLLGLGLTVSSVAVLAGCSVGPIPELVIAEELDTNKQITIEFWHQSQLKDGVDPYQKYADEFKKEYPNITVKPTTKESYGALSDAVEAGIAARKYPNLTLGYSNNFVEYMTVNAVANLTGFIEHPKYGFSDADIKDFKDAGFWSDNTVYDDKGTVYSLSLAKSSEAMYVNMDMVEAVNGTAEELSTWEGVYEISQRMKAAGNPVYQWHHDTTANWAITLLNQAGVDYTSINSDGKGVIEFLNGSQQATKDLFNKYILADAYNGLASIRATSGAYGSGQLMDQVWDKTLNDGAGGLKPSAPKVWMNIGSSSAGNYYDNHTFELAVLPVPQMAAGVNDYAVLQGPSMAMLVHGDAQENLATWLFMQYLTSKETNIQIAKDTGYMPVRESCYNEDSFKALLEGDEPRVLSLKAAIAQKHCYEGTPAFLGSNETRSAVGKIIDEILGTTPVTLDKAFDNARSALFMYNK